MTRVRVESFSISVDGYGAGPQQDSKNPLGVGGTQLHDWAFQTRTFQSSVLGSDGGSTGLDDEYAARGLQNVGAWIIGRNMFGPIRGPWPDMTWKGWWGKKPPYDCSVFVLTHHTRPAIEMENATIFHLVTEGIHRALELARNAAGGKDVRIGGGPSIIRQYLHEGLIDEMHIAIVPVLLGKGEPLFQDLDLPALGYRCVEHKASEAVTHVILKREELNDAQQVGPADRSAKPSSG